MRGLFFTGTDTGVGKTVVTAAVARCLRLQRQLVCVCKPVATGGTLVEGVCRCEDTEQLAAAVGHEQTLEAITPWAFVPPVAPPVAVRLAGKVLTLSDVVQAVRANARPNALMLVEGVGGLLCPLTERATVADLIGELGLPVIVVARRSLGTLNHTLLTLEVACGRGLRVAGVVMSETTPPTSLAETTNVEELRQRIDVPLLAVIPWQPAGGDPAGNTLAAVDWRRLCEVGKQ
jgi:dethiobiotin synthetase